MARSGKKAATKVKKAMEERKKGTLKSGSGKKVKSRKQAVAIGLSEARKAGAKVPRKKKASSKTGTKKAAAKRSTKKGATKKAATKKSATRKGAKRKSSKTS
jgi:hypothetical protein